MKWDPIVTNFPSNRYLFYFFFFFQEKNWNKFTIHPVIYLKNILACLKTRTSLVNMLLQWTRTFVKFRTLSNSNIISTGGVASESFFQPTHSYLQKIKFGNLTLFHLKYENCKVTWIACLWLYDGRNTAQYDMIVEMPSQSQFSKTKSLFIFAK